MANYQNLTAEQVKAKLDRGEQFRLIDVREPHEHRVARIEGAELMPLSQASAWVESFSEDEEIVLFCHHGARSAQVASFLAGQRGLPKVANMLGGINEWSARVDPSVPVY